MLFIPSAIARKAYVKDSFQRTDGGFCFQVYNRLAPGTVLSIQEVQVNGCKIRLEQVRLISADGQHTPATAISPSAPYEFPFHQPVTIAVDDHPIQPGQHVISLVAQTREVGRCKVQAALTL